MRTRFVGRALGACIFSAMLTACGVSLPQATTSELTQTAREATIATHGISWMSGGNAREDLLYVTNRDGVVNVYRYWQQKLVGILTDFTLPLGECVDAAGDIYIADYKAERLVEYAHGGTKPINVIDVSPYSPYGCSVDLSSGNLAVANYRDGSYNGGNIAIYRHAKGKPLYYTDRNLRFYESCAYDDRGNLLVTDGEYGSSFYGSNFAYLGKKSVKLVTVDITGGSSYGSGFSGVSGLGWDGKYWILNTYAVFRIVLNGTHGHAVGTTNLNGTYSSLGPVWIYNNHHSGPQGTQVVAAWSNYRSVNDVGYWKYPAGGSILHEISNGLAEPYGVAVSLKQQ
jgi:hypothetical protein